MKLSLRSLIAMPLIAQVVVVTAMTDGSPIVTVKPPPTLGLSFVRSYVDADNQFQGVLGADFTLEAVEQFVERVHTRHASAMFLMDADGKVLASSTGPPFFQEQTASPSAQQLQQPSLVQTTATTSSKLL